MPFDANFYREVLPERVTAECHGRPDAVPVVKLQLANGQVLDLCHIVHLADDWFAVQHYRDAETCADMDLAFLPYGLVGLITVSLHHPGNRRIGFSVREKPALSKAAGARSEQPDPGDHRQTSGEAARPLQELR